MPTCSTSSASTVISNEYNISSIMPGSLWSVDVGPVLLSLPFLLRLGRIRSPVTQALVLQNSGFVEVADEC